MMVKVAPPQLVLLTISVQARDVAIWLNAAEIGASYRLLIGKGTYVFASQCQPPVWNNTAALWAGQAARIEHGERRASFSPHPNALTASGPRGSIFAGAFGTEGGAGPVGRTGCWLLVNQSSHPRDQTTKHEVTQ